jgi:hypothetical protein
MLNFGFTLITALYIHRNLINFMLMIFYPYTKSYNSLKINSKSEENISFNIMNFSTQRI